MGSLQPWCILCSYLISSMSSAMSFCSSIYYHYHCDHQHLSLIIIFVIILLIINYCDHNQWRRLSPGRAGCRADAFCWSLMIILIMVVVMMMIMMPNNPCNSPSWSWSWQRCSELMIIVSQSKIKMMTTITCSRVLLLQGLDLWQCKKVSLKVLTKIWWNRSQF